MLGFEKCDLHKNNFQIILLDNLQKNVNQLALLSILSKQIFHF